MYLFINNFTIFSYIYDISYIYIYSLITNSHKYMITANLNYSFGHFKPFFGSFAKTKQFSYCWFNNLCDFKIHKTPRQTILTSNDSFALAFSSYTDESV